MRRVGSKKNRTTRDSEGFRRFPTQRGEGFNLAYLRSLRESRRCTATTRGGLPCRAFVMWDSPHKLCLVHSGLGHHGPQPWWRASSHVYARYPRCNCEAYGWPHRPGGGACIWPEGLIRLAAEKSVPRS